MALGPYRVLVISVDHTSDRIRDRDIDGDAMTKEHPAHAVHTYMGCQCCLAIKGITLHAGGMSVARSRETVTDLSDLDVVHDGTYSLSVGIPRASAPPWPTRGSTHVKDPW